MKILSFIALLALATPYGYGSEPAPELELGAAAARPVAEAAWLDNITAIDATPGSELYAAKIPHRADFGDKELYCVMERVNETNVEG